MHTASVSQRIFALLYAKCYHITHWHPLGSITWILPAIGIHHFDYPQASPFQKPVGLMDGMASPRGSACLRCNFASLARTGFHFKHVSRMETFRGESKFTKEERLQNSRLKMGFEISFIFLLFNTLPTSNTIKSVSSYWN